MTNNPTNGAGYLVQGLRLLNQSGLRRFVLIPLAINVIVFSLLIWLGIDQFEGVLDWLLPETGWLVYLRWLLWPLFAITGLLVVFFTSSSTVAEAKYF